MKYKESGLTLESKNTNNIKQTEKRQINSKVTQRHNIDQS